MNQVFYKKIGGKYVPVAEYDHQLSESFPEGATLVLCQPGSRSRRFNINPNYAAMIAAGRVAEETISKELVRLSDLRPRRKPITQEQRDAWENLSKAFGQDMHLLEWPSAREVAEKAVGAMMAEAEKLLQKPEVRKAFEQFLLIAELHK